MRIGINLSKFNSIAVHRNSQLDDIRVMIVLKIIIDEDMIKNGEIVNDIKI